jgi:3D (Asp-Asp-Asp) domain-containing protein
MHKKILTSVMLLPALFLAGCAGQQKNAACKPGQKCTAGTIRKVRTTAYTRFEAGGNKSAVGTRLSNGSVKSAAADWSLFPLGTKFKILCTGEIFLVEDYGSALVGKNTIDLYKISGGAMRRWGARNVDIQILEWGSAEKSLEVLRPRARNPHVQVMIDNLRRQS